MNPDLPLAGRAVLAAACLPPLLTTVTWTINLLPYSHPAQAVAGLLAGAALAVAVTLTAKISSGPHRRHLGALTAAAAAAYLLPVVVFSASSALSVAAFTLGCWLVLLAGTSVVQRVPDWFTAMRSRAATAVAHALCVAVDVATFGAIASVCTQATVGGGGHLATAATLLPLLIARAAARRHTIISAVYDDALMLDIVWAYRPTDPAADPNRTIRATCPVPPRGDSA